MGNDEKLETTFEKTMRKLVQRSHQVDIFVEEKKNTNNSAIVNNVAMVVPAANLIPTDQGKVEITLKGPNSTDVVVWFPEPWFTYDGGGKTAANPLTIKANEKVVLVVDPAKTGGNKIRPYQVWAKNINEFAVGDSPPKMVLDP